MNENVFFTIVKLSNSYSFEIFDNNLELYYQDILNRLDNFNDNELESFFKLISTNKYTDLQLSTMWEESKPDFFFTSPEQVRQYFLEIYKYKKRL